MESREYLRSLIGRSDSVLEIGPGPHPVAPKALGFKTTVTDFMPAESVRNTFAAHGVDTSQIEDVDIVTSDLAELRDRGLRFDKIVASHVIEHTPDMIGFLSACQGMLTDRGQLLLIVPDKRFDFDYYRPHSTTGALLDAYRTKRRNHYGAVFDMVAYQATIRGQLAWPRDELAEPILTNPADQARQVMTRLSAINDYADAHEWTFTPSSFKLLLHDLRDLGLLNLHECYFDERGFEFVCILSCDPRLEPDRLQLLQSIEMETVIHSRSHLRAQEQMSALMLSRYGLFKAFLRAVRAKGLSLRGLF